MQKWQQKIYISCLLLPKNNREAYYTGNLTPKLVLIFTPYHFIAIVQKQIWSKKPSGTSLPIFITEWDDQSLCSGTNLKGSKS